MEYNVRHRFPTVVYSIHLFIYCSFSMRNVNSNIWVIVLIFKTKIKSLKSIKYKKHLNIFKIKKIIGPTPMQNERKGNKTIRNNFHPTVLKRFALYWNRFRQCSFVRLFDTKSVPGISRKPFELESPDFIGKSIPTLCTATPDMTSLSTSGRKL